MARAFIVSVHDVEPRFLPELSQIVDALRPRIGATMSAAVVPAPTRAAHDDALVTLVQSHFEEFALHGYSHRTQYVWHPMALLTDGANEFSGLTAVEAQRRLRLGQTALRELFGAPATVLIPPAWCRGPVTVQAAADEGLLVTVTLGQLLTVQGRVPLATYSWDCGRLGVLGYAGEWLGKCLRGIPCITFHPVDVRRGFLRRGLNLVDRLLAAGLRPQTFAGCAAELIKAPGEPVHAERN